MQCSYLGVQSSSISISIRPACLRPQLTRSGCRRRSLIQRRPWRPVNVRAVSDHHRHAVDEQTGQNSGLGSQYPSNGHNQHSQSYEQQYGVPQYPGPPPQYNQRGSSGGGAWPNLLWVLVGVVIATVVSKVYGVVSSPGGFQGWMMQQAMKAAMKGMPQPGQPGQPGQPPNPFAGMGSMPGGFPNLQPGGQQSPPGWPPVVDTTARPADQRPQQQSQQAQATSATSHQPPYNQDVNKGKRFQEHKQKQASKATSTEASPKSTASSAPGTSTPPPSSFVDPPKQAASFTDVEDDEAASSSTASSNAAGASTAQQSSSGPQFGAYAQPQQVQEQEASSSTKPGSKGAVDVMERMLKDPNMQKMLYPYLPEGMRNPQTFEWMMSNPEYRSQLEQMLEKQGAMDPKMMDALQGDANAGNWEEQLKALNMTPEEVIQKIMSDPELAGSFSKPEVQAAIMDCTQDPMNILKYQSNEEIMRVFSKMQELFPAQGPPGSMPMP